MLPVISVHADRHPTLGMILLSGVALISLALSLAWRTFYYDAYNRILQGMKFFIFSAMVSGLLAAVLNDKTRSEPLWLFGTLCAIAAVSSYIVYFRHYRSERRVLSLTSSGARVVATTDLEKALRKELGKD